MMTDRYRLMVAAGRLTDAGDLAAVALARIHLRGAESITCPCDRCAVARSIIGAPPPAVVVSPTEAATAARRLELDARVARERRAAMAELQRRGYGWVIGWDPRRR